MTYDSEKLFSSQLIFATFVEADVVKSLHRDDIDYHISNVF